MKKFTIFDIIILAIFMIFFYVLYVVNKVEKKKYFNDINKNKSFGVGKITGYGKGRWSHGIRYCFLNSSGSHIHSSSTLRFEVNDKDKFINQLFPVIYSRKDSKKNEILIFESDFIEWGLSYPDSLKWVNSVYH